MKAKKGLTQFLVASQVKEYITTSPTSKAIFKFFLLTFFNKKNAKNIR